MSQVWELAVHYANALSHDIHSLTGPVPNVSSWFGFIFSLSHFLSAFLSFQCSLSLLGQSGSVGSGQVISGLIGRLMFLQKPGTLTCLSSSHALPPKWQSQTCWRLTETHTTVLFEDFSQPVKGCNDMRWVRCITGGRHNWSEGLEKWLLVLTTVISYDSIALDLLMRL